MTPEQLLALWALRYDVDMAVGLLEPSPQQTNVFILKLIDILLEKEG